MNEDNKHILFVLIPIIIGVIGIFILINHFGNITERNNDKARDDACRDVGMVSYEYFDGKRICIDENNDAHFIILECEGIFWGINPHCEAQIITVGALRVTIN